MSFNDRLANDVRRNGTHSSGTDDDRVLRALVHESPGSESGCRCRIHDLYFIVRVI